MELEVTERGASVRFAVRVAPRARRPGVVGLHGGALKVAVEAPPVDGAANAALIALLARRLSVRKRDVAIVRGAGGRTKLVEVRGVDADAVRALLGG